MSQDIVADGLNQVMNSKRVGKTTVVIKRYSKLLLNLFEMMKAKGHIDYSVDEETRTVTVEVIKLNECKAVKPRYYASVDTIEKYMRRFLPSRNFGDLVISTNKGLMNHKDAISSNMGGSVIAYFY